MTDPRRSPGHEHAVPTRLTFVGLAVLLALAGCTSTPPLAEPTVTLPDRFPGTPLEDAQAPSSDWRDYFRDARLVALIEQALAHNRDLRLAAARVREARALAQVAGAERGVPLDLGVALSSTRTPAGLTSSGRAQRSERWGLDVGLLNWEIDLWGRLARLEEAAAAQLAASEETQRAAQASLIAETANQYLLWLELGERLRLADAALEARRRTLELIERRRDVGLANDSELLAQRGALASLRAERAALIRQRDAVFSGLTLLVGQPVDALPGGALPQLPPIEAGLPSELLLRRPDLRAAEARLRAARANVEAARLAFLPRISLTAALGLASRQLGELIDVDSGAWNFNPVVRLPLFDDGRRAGNVDLAAARQVAAVAEYEKAIQQALREVAELLAARAAWLEQWQAHRAAEEAQRHRFTLAEARFAAGASSLLEVLDAQRELWTAESARVQAERARLATEIALYKALGGGAPR